MHQIIRLHLSMASTIFLNLNHSWQHSTTVNAGNQTKPIKSIKVKGKNIWITEANLLPLIFFFIFILHYFFVQVKQLYLRNVFLVNELCFWKFTCESRDTAAVKTVELSSFLVAV